MGRLITRRQLRRGARPEITRAQLAVLDVMRAAPGPLTAAQIVAESGLSERSAWYALAALVDRRWVRRRGELVVLR